MKAWLSIIYRAMVAIVIITNDFSLFESFQMSFYSMGDWFVQDDDQKKPSLKFQSELDTDSEKNQSTCSTCIFAVDTGRKHMARHTTSNADNGNDKMRKYLFVIICHCNFHAGTKAVA